ncbi:MAG: S8 family peptidase [Acidimicrobiales bacterium]
MHRSRLVALALTGLLALGIAPARANNASSAALPQPGLEQLADITGSTTGIATLDAIPTAAVTAALTQLGLTVQPMEHLPLVIVRGPVAAMRAAAATGIVQDVYPDQRIELLDTASSDAMGAAPIRKAGFTGKGVTVGVVDSGCDATQPDLADHVAHNVKLISGEYANQKPEARNTIVLPIDQGPYSNTDLGSGHGTHVAGIIAADGHTGLDHMGVAPDASLVCLSIGEVLFTTAVVTAYDYLMDQPGLWGVDVINNSWGNTYGQFDPRHPIQVATKAITDLGVDVVFAAGNSGDGNGEATLNPWSQAPWVTSVAAETLKHERGSFSSNGLVLDNSAPSQIGAGGRTTYLGERVGVVHPDVAAPGVDISSTCDTTGTVVGPCPPGENTTASGTSMASPHVAGAIAVILQANPRLTNVQVQQILQTTAKPVKALDAAGKVTTANAPFWQVGYGRVDLAAAVMTARSSSAMNQLSKAETNRELQVLAATGYKSVRSDWATWEAPPVSAGTDVRTFQVTKDPTANRLRVAIMFPSEATLGAGFGLTEYSVVVKDAKGNVLVSGTTPTGIGTAAAFVTVPTGTVGPYAVTVTGDRSLSDPDSLDSGSVLGDTITLAVVQAIRR